MRAGCQSATDFEASWEAGRKALRARIDRQQRALGAKSHKRRGKGWQMGVGYRDHECMRCGEAVVWVSSVVGAERWTCAGCGESELERVSAGAVPCSETFRAEHFSGPVGLHFEQDLARYLEEQRNTLLRSRNHETARKPFTGTGYIKKLARVAVYEEACRRWMANRLYDHQRERPRVLMLPGGEPEHEASLARTVLPGAEVIAVDVNERAVEAARPFVDLAVQADVGSFRFKGRDETPDELSHRYVLANLDFCGLVTSGSVGAAIERAGHMACYIATWFSYGHDPAKLIADRAERILDFGDEELIEHFSLLPETIRNRLLFVYREVQYSNPSFNRVGRVRLQALKVWAYRDQRMPMLCVLWCLGGSEFDEPSVLPFEKVTASEDDYRIAALASADTRGADYACSYYGTTKPQLSAWKAVATRRARKVL